MHGQVRISSDCMEYSVSSWMRIKGTKAQNESLSLLVDRTDGDGCSQDCQQLCHRELVGTRHVRSKSILMNHAQGNNSSTIRD